MKTIRKLLPIALSLFMLAACQTTGEKGDKGDSGTPGINGVTPHIDSTTNHWFIGDVDTGINATGEKGDPGITYIPCLFYNYDGTFLKEERVEKGTNAVYTGSTPSRPSDVSGLYTNYYAFDGWDKSLENITEPMSFRAKFKIRPYNVRYVNYDNTFLYSTQVNQGDSSIYNGPTPTRASEGDHVFTFIGWDKPETIYNDTTLIAQYECPQIYRTCTFLNYNGDELYKVSVEEGSSVEYKGILPTKPSEDIDDGTYTEYTFTGWDKSLKNITVNTTFTAQFGANKTFAISFLDWDDTVLYETTIFEGGYVAYKGETPTRADDEGYKVRFLDDNDELLYEYHCKKGEKAIYPYDEPFKYNDKYATIFLGWDKDLNNVQSSITTKARYYYLDASKCGLCPGDTVQGTLYDEILDYCINNSIEYRDTYFEYNGNYYTYDSISLCFYEAIPIQWHYLGEKDGGALLISSNIIKELWVPIPEVIDPYCDSPLRKYLLDYEEKAFIDDSLLLIATVDNSVASSLIEDNIYSCPTTYDKMFVLSNAEVVEYYNYSYKMPWYSTEENVGPSFTTRSQGDGGWYFRISKTSWYINGMFPPGSYVFYIRPCVIMDIDISQPTTAEDFN